MDVWLFYEICKYFQKRSVVKVVCCATKKVAQHVIIVLHKHSVIHIAFLCKFCYLLSTCILTTMDTRSEVISKTRCSLRISANF